MAIFNFPAFLSLPIASGKTHEKSAKSHGNHGVKKIQLRSVNSFGKQNAIN